MTLDYTSPMHLGQLNQRQWVWTYTDMVVADLYCIDFMPIPPEIIAKVVSMPYTVQSTKYGPYRKFSGHVTTGELLRSLTETQSHPDFDSFKFSIADFLEVKTYDLAEFDLLKYRAQVRGGEYLNSGMISGLVVTDPEIIELLKTRYEAFTNYRVGYFSTLESCKKWIEESIGKTVQLD